MIRPSRGVDPGPFSGAAPDGGDTSDARADVRTTRDSAPSDSSSGNSGTGGSGGSSDSSGGAGGGSILPAICGTTLTCTRGAVLLARGELEEAEQMLIFAFEQNPLKSRALSACLLAIVFAKRNRTTDARAWLERARLLDASCELLPRASAEIV